MNSKTFFEVSLTYDLVVSGEDLPALLAIIGRSEMIHRRYSASAELMSAIENVVFKGVSEQALNEIRMNTVLEPKT